MVPLPVLVPLKADALPLCRKSGLYFIRGLSRTFKMRVLVHQNLNCVSCTHAEPAGVSSAGVCFYVCPACGHWRFFLGGGSALLQPPLSEQSRWTPPVPSHCVCAHQDGQTGTLPSLPSSSTLPSAIFGGGYKYL